MWCGDRVVVVGSGVVVVWCVLCMCMYKSCVFSTCARGAGIHGDVVNVYTVEGEGER